MEVLVCLCCSEHSILQGTSCCAYGLCQKCGKDYLADACCPFCGSTELNKTLQPLNDPTWLTSETKLIEIISRASGLRQQVIDLYDNYKTYDTTHLNLHLEFYKNATVKPYEHYISKLEQILNNLSITKILFEPKELEKPSELVRVIKWFDDTCQLFEDSTVPQPQIKMDRELLEHNRIRMKVEVLGSKELGSLQITSTFKRKDKIPEFYTIDFYKYENKKIKLHISYISYNKLKSITHYNKGKRNGWHHEYLDGKLIVRAHYWNNKLHGVYETRIIKQYYSYDKLIYATNHNLLSYRSEGNYSYFDIHNYHSDNSFHAHVQCQWSGKGYDKHKLLHYQIKSANFTAERDETSCSMKGLADTISYYHLNHLHTIQPIHYIRRENYASLTFVKDNIQTITYHTSDTSYVNDTFSFRFLDYDQLYEWKHLITSKNYFE